MQQTEQTSGWGGTERKRVEAVVETLATLRSEGENLAELAHDARNMVTALGLYCDLLEEPGVLSTPYRHYGNELRLVAAASRRLVEKLVALDTQDGNNRDYPAAGSPWAGVREGGRPPQSAMPGQRPASAWRWDLLPPVPIENLAAELLANRNLLAALAGPSIALTVDTVGGALPVLLTAEDLTRILVNLVKNSAEAMPAGGRIQLHLHEQTLQPGAQQMLSLTIEDSGLGIPAKVLGKIFEPGFSTRTAASGSTSWQAAHRGLGLPITRSIIEAAGGRIWAENRHPAGTCMRIELPVRRR